MLTIPTAALLQAWERGHDASAGERGLILLRAAYPEVPAVVLAGWPVGQRDAALLDLFERLFGTRLAAQAECPRCSVALETDFPVSAISAPFPKLTSNRFVLECAGCQLTYRLPTAGDLAALADPAVASGDARTKSRWLLRRCVLRVGKTGQAESHDHGQPEPGLEERTAQTGIPAPADIPTCDATDISDEVLEALETAIATTVTAVDPLAEIEVKLDCPDCGFSWHSPFDIVSFLWSELDAWAKQMLREIHVLASHYGWSEGDIIALSPQRRQHYRGLIGI
jgi:hypothetical protein